MNLEIIRDIKIARLQNEYKCISSYEIPKDVHEWLPCRNCKLRPLIWEFNNGSSTACGCGEDEYRHFSIHAESIMSYVTRHNGSALNYPSDGLKKNWNKWVMTGECLVTHSELRRLGRW
jgi:hypothetical protein